jgi:general secretion pathway protein E
LLPIYTEENKDDEADETTGEPVRTLHIATFDPLSLVAHQRVAASLTMPVVWHVGQRTRIVEGLQKLYGLGADTFEKILRGRADWGAEDFAG